MRRGEQVTTLNVSLKVNEVIMISQNLQKKIRKSRIKSALSHLQVRVSSVLAKESADGKEIKWMSNRPRMSMSESFDDRRSFS